MLGFVVAVRHHPVPMFFQKCRVPIRKQMLRREGPPALFGDAGDSTVADLTGDCSGYCQPTHPALEMAILLTIASSLQHTRKRFDINESKVRLFFLL